MMISDFSIRKHSPSTTGTYSTQVHFQQVLTPSVCLHHDLRRIDTTSIGNQYFVVTNMCASSFQKLDIEREGKRSCTNSSIKKRLIFSTVLTVKESITNKKIKTTFILL